MTDGDFEVIWDDTHKEPAPSYGDGDRLTYMIEGSDWSKFHHLVKVERKRQLPTKFGSVIKTAGNGTVLVLVAGLTSGVPHWCREDGMMYRASTMQLSPGWTLVRDGVD